MIILDPVKVPVGDSFAYAIPDNAPTVYTSMVFDGEHYVFYEEGDDTLDNE